MFASDGYQTSKNPVLNWNHTITKLKHLQLLVLLHQINGKKYDASRISEFAVRYLDHQSPEVRENAYLVLLRQYE